MGRESGPWSSTSRSSPRPTTSGAFGSRPPLWGRRGPVLFRLPTPPGGDMPADQSFGASSSTASSPARSASPGTRRSRIASTRDARLRLTPAERRCWRSFRGSCSTTGGLPASSGARTARRWSGWSTARRWIIARRSKDRSGSWSCSPARSVRFEDELRWADLQNAVESLVKGGRIILERLYDASPRALVGAMRGREVHVLHIVRDGADLETGALTVRDLEPLVADHLAPPPGGPRPAWPGRDGRTAAFGETAVRLVRHGCPAVAHDARTDERHGGGGLRSVVLRTRREREPVDVALAAGASTGRATPDPRVAATWALFAGRSASLEFGDDPGSASRPPTAHRTPRTRVRRLTRPPPVGDPGAPGRRRGRCGAPARRGRRVAESLALTGPTDAPDGRPPRPGTAPPTGTRTAYPRIDVRARRHLRPDVVVVEEPFDVDGGPGPVPGLGARPDRRHPVRPGPADRPGAGPHFRPQLAGRARPHAADAGRDRREPVPQRPGRVHGALPPRPADGASDRRALPARRAGRRHRVAALRRGPVGRRRRDRGRATLRAEPAHRPRAPTRCRPARPRPVDLRVGRRGDRRVRLDRLCRQLGRRRA